MERRQEESLIGCQLGNYRVCEAIAEGGMGTVYRAVRVNDFEKQVAVKLVKRGMDTDFILRRFRRERQILSGLDHPNIASLLDGGAAPDGRPYLVMEYIEGIPITDYADQHKLAIPERLEMFRTVCSAVQYAHQNLVVHRDLKPSNILVTAGGVPKLLDFGIAKLLEPDADSTMTMQRLMTPEFASPEQARGLAVTTATDIYSLGMLLYVLLTGEHPYRFTTHNPEEIARVVCETEPRRPSAVRPISRDLDNIVLKSIHKEPARRYVSAEQLSEDIRRYLAGMPVSARKDTAAYRASKFLGRHKAACVAGALIAISLIAGLGATLWEARASERERQIAEQRLKDVRALASSNLFELHDSIAQLPGSAAARNLVIQRGLTYLDKLQAQDASDPELMREVAVGYERIAGLQGRFTGAGIGDSQAALANYRKAFALRSALVMRFPGNPADVKAEIGLSQGYVQCLLQTAHTEEALQVASTALDLATDLRNRYPQDPGIAAVAAAAHLRLAGVQGGDGSSPSTREFQEAIAHDQRAMDLVAPLDRPGVSPAVRSLIVSAKLILAFHLYKDRQIQKAIRIFDDIVSAKGSSPRILLSIYNQRGNSFARAGDRKRALSDYQNALALAKAAAHADPTSLETQLEVAILTGLIAHEEARLGEREKSDAELAKAIENVERLAAANPIELFYGNIFLVGYSFQGESLSAAGDQAGARAKYSKSLKTAEGAARNDRFDLESRLTIAKIHAALGILWARSSEYREAQREFAASEQLTGELLKGRPADTDALDLSRLLRRYSENLEACVEGQHCQPVERFQLPTLIT
ncbi:MAG TPA: serine/threonine-protein kinase [Bryobacteraceae bacterium]|nr:serine/threonine-protein kinase [Bryobacteraceae bacterium]